MLAGGVLLGMAALVVDVGTLYTEREELLSGADAAAQRLALDCSRTGGLCGDQDFTRAAAAADGNAKDSLSSVDLICGHESGGRLDKLSRRSRRGLDHLLEQRTHEWRELGRGAHEHLGLRRQDRPAAFLRPGHGSRIHRRNGPRVLPGGLWSDGRGLAVTMSSCEWDKYTGNGTDFAPLPAYPPNPAARYEHAVLLHDPSKQGQRLRCRTGGQGRTGRIRLDRSDESLPHGHRRWDLYRDTGNSAPKDCPAELAKLRATGPWSWSHL